MTASNLLKYVLHWKGYGEEGTLSWWFSGAGGTFSPEQLQAAAGAAVTSMQTNETPSSWSNFLGMLSTAQSVDQVALYSYADPAVAATALGIAVPSSPTGTATLKQGLQNALVATLLTARAGASFRGRQYFPAHCTVPSSTTALETNSDVDKVASTAANMANDIKGALQTSLGIPTLDWCVYSRTKGLATAVTQVKVNNRADTQRRRIAGLSATYTTTVTA